MAFIMFGELGRRDALRAIGHRVFWIVMHFDNQAIGAGSHRGAAHAIDKITLARSLAGDRSQPGDG